MNLTAEEGQILVSAPTPPDEAVATAPTPKGGMARNTVNLLMGQIMTTALTIVLSAVVARTLGAQDFGVLYLVTSVATFAYVFVDWGHGTYVIREVARHPQRTGELMGTVLVVRAITALTLTGPAVLTAWLLGYTTRTLVFIVVMMAAWLPMYLGLSFGWAFRGRERMEFDALIGVVLKFLTLVLALFLLFNGGRLLAYMMAIGIAGLVTCVVATAIYRHLNLGTLRVTSKMARELIIGGAPMVTMTIAVAAQPYIDANIMSRLTPAAVLGWYGAATTFSNTLMAPAFILASASYPRLSVAAGDLPSFRKILHNAMRPLLFVAVLGAVGTYLFADVAVNIVYSATKFGPSGSILRAFTPAMVLVFIDMLLVTAILAAGRAVHIATAKLIAVVATTGLELFLVPFCQARWGNGGIAVMLAFGGGELVMIAASIYLMPQGALESSIALDLLRALGAGAGTLLIVTPFIRVSPFVAIPGCVIVFSILAAVVGLLTRADLELLTGMLRRRAATAS
jgi:O-antigen/teichoic acid export membrane protein